MTRYYMVTAKGEVEITRKSAEYLNSVYDEMWGFVDVTTAAGENLKVNPYQVIMIREESADRTRFILNVKEGAE